MIYNPNSSMSISICLLRNCFNTVLESLYFKLYVCFCNDRMVMQIKIQIQVYQENEPHRSRTKRSIHWAEGLGYNLDPTPSSGFNWHCFSSKWYETGAEIWATYLGLSPIDFSGIYFWVFLGTVISTTQRVLYRLKGLFLLCNIRKNQSNFDKNCRYTWTELHCPVHTQAIASWTEMEEPWDGGLIFPLLIHPWENVHR